MTEKDASCMMLPAAAEAPDAPLCRQMPAEMPVSLNSRKQGLPERFGRFLERNQKGISVIQWAMVLVYFLLLLIPAFTSWDSAQLTARTVFWGIGWPLIVFSMLAAGRLWCGILCPDGTLTEFISRHGRKNSIPRWIRWSGWPCLVLAASTIYGQMTGFLTSFPATLVLLGIPTCLAAATGFLYGNGHRIWCMYLCPGNGFFSILAKTAFFSFRVDRLQWKAYTGPAGHIRCAPLINISKMKSASACHACGRCSGYRNAVTFSARMPHAEILNADSKEISGSELFLLIWGIIGICTAALAGPASRSYTLFIRAMDHAGLLLQFDTPWWLAESSLSFYKAFFILASGTFISLFVYFLLRAAGALSGAASWRQLAYGLIPVSVWGIFSGLARNSLAVWAECGFPFSGSAVLEYIILIPAAAFSILAGAAVLRRGKPARRALPLALYILPVLFLCAVWTCF